MVRNTHNLEATGQTAGRLATKIATLLRGKHKTNFQPNYDQGDIVIVANVDKLKFTGKKFDQKKYHHYSGYPGGLKSKKLSDVFKNKPGEVLKRAVREMLPPVRFRNDMIKRLIIK